MDKARQQIVLARFVGKIAVDRGAREVRHLLLGEVDHRPRPAPQGQENPDDESNDATSPSEDHLTADRTDGTDRVCPEQESLALPDYDQLPAAHVIAKLPSLSQGERDAIENYEICGRHRRTVLGKLTQLRADQDEA
ncbi:MAG: hypothetical protein DRJ50_06975 [Actinobacteria bacterium]|nr:MAG: hypothetical protein DRJ50_06975 [Actinomycetota bacterium]